MEVMRATDEGFGRAERTSYLGSLYHFASLDGQLRHHLNECVLERTTTRGGDAGAGGGRRGLLMAEEYLFLTLFGCITFGVPPLMKLAQLFFNWYNQRPNRTQIETYAEDGDWNFEDEIEGVYIPPDQRAEKEVERGPRGKGRGRKG